MEKKFRSNKKFLKEIAIILSIILLILDIWLYIKMKFAWTDIGSNHNQYENASLIIVGLFRYGILLWGILAILIVWIEYFWVKLFIKIYNKFDNFKKVILCIIISVIISTILIFFIRILSLILMNLI